MMTDEPIPTPPHPGTLIREMMDEVYGLTIVDLAKVMNLNRANLSNVVNGKVSVTRELAYKIDAFLCYCFSATDEGFHFAQELIEAQATYDWHNDQALRDAAVSAAKSRRGGQTALPAPTVPE